MKDGTDATERTRRNRLHAGTLLSTRYHVRCWFYSDQSSIVCPCGQRSFCFLRSSVFDLIILVLFSDFVGEQKVVAFISFCRRSREYKISRCSRAGANSVNYLRCSRAGGTNDLRQAFGPSYPTSIYCGGCIRVPNRKFTIEHPNG